MKQLNNRQKTVIWIGVAVVATAKGLVRRSGGARKFPIVWPLSYRVRKKKNDIGL